MQAMSAGDLRGDEHKIRNFHVFGFISVATQNRAKPGNWLSQPHKPQNCDQRSACTELHA